MPDLPATFPPPRPPAPPRHNLPAALTSFVGREQELAEVVGLLGTTRLLTLTGPGGVGKTRLALQAAPALLAGFPDGAWLVELAPLTDPALVAQAVAAVLGRADDADAPPRQTILDTLRDRHLLLLLDNCEHLVEPVAALAGAILAGCPRVCILASSREPLGLPGETIWRVPPLALPPPAPTPADPHQAHAAAVRLFLDRARAIRPELAPTPAEAAAIAQICIRLDGIPLALELAAARINVLPVAGIAAGLDDRFRLLTGGGRNRLPRQQTLQALIAWSYDLLPSVEQGVFRRLAVFAGGWTEDAARAVAADPAPEPGVRDQPPQPAPAVPESAIPTALEGLVHKSLVMVDAGAAAAPRYRLLETIRQYAQDRLLESGEAARVRARHRDWCLHLAETAEPELRGPAPEIWSRRLETEHDNLRAALEWCLAEEDGATAGLRLAGALWQFWLLRHWNEGRYWLEAVLARPGAARPTAARAKALYAAGALTLDSPLARARLEESVRLWRRLGDRLGLAYALDALADEARMQGDLAAARVSAEESVALFRLLGDNRGLAGCLFQMGRTFLDGGDLVFARVLLQESLTLARQIGDKPGIGNCLYQLGRATLAASDLAGAQALFEESLALQRERGATEAVAWALNSLGEVARAGGDYAAAGGYYAESLALHRQLGNNYGVAALLHNLGYVALRQGEPEQARVLFAESLAVAGELGRKLGVVEGLIGLAGVAAAVGALGRAARLFGAATAELTAIGAALVRADRVEYEHDLAATREALDTAAWKAAWQAGGRLPLEEAVAEALQP